jgi:perosamine synthetase
VVSLEPPAAAVDAVVRPVPGTIPVAGPWITEREVDAVANAVRSSWYGGAGVEVREFEAEFAASVGRRHAIALPSCTSGLHLALLALGIGPGDEVVVTETTWIASATPIVYVGATPIFVDIEPDTWCAAIESVKAVLTPRTKAIVVVDLYGGFPDFAAFEALAAERGIALIEDAAQTAGGIHDGRAAGSFGDISAFSFHGTKTLTTGEGGMVLCDDPELDARMRFLGDHGRVPGDRSFRNLEVGWKYKMGELQAALGRVQLARIEELVARKRQIFGWYQERLRGAPVELNFERPGERNVYFMVTAILDEASGLTPIAVRDELDSYGIATRPFFIPLSALPAFADSPDTPRARRENPVCYQLSDRGLNLPSALMLTESDVDLVCERFLSLLDRAPASDRA